MKLSEMIRDEIDGGEECRGRDTQLTEWVRLAERLENKLAWAENKIALVSARAAFAAAYPDGPVPSNGVRNE